MKTTFNLLTLLLLFAFTAMPAAAIDETKTPIPGLKAEVLGVKRLGQGAIVILKWVNTTPNEMPLALNYAQYFLLDSGDRINLEYAGSGNIPAEAPLKDYFYTRQFPSNISSIPTLVISGRGSYTPKKTKNNPDGDFTYTFKNVPFEEAPYAPNAKAAFYSPDMKVGALKPKVVGNDLEIYFTLTNTMNKSREISTGYQNGQAYDDDGEVYDVSAWVTGEYQPDEPMKCKILIKNGARVKEFRKINMPVFDTEYRGFDTYFGIRNYTPDFSNN